MTAPIPPLGVNPADAAEVLKTLLEVWSVAAERMLITVARRLARGVEQDGWAERKGREVLAVRDELLQITRGLDRQSPALVEKAMREAYQLGQRAARTLDQPVMTTRADEVMRLTEQYFGRLHGSFLPVVRAHEDVYRRAVLDAELQMRTGTITRRDAIAHSVDRLLAQGRDRFTDEAGRRWHLDAYARMAGRTAAGQAAVEGQLDGQTATGRDLVVISDSLRECGLCRPWEGRLLSISGASVGEETDGHRVVGTIAEARAAGLWHPNCSHRADPYTPGLTRVPTPDANPGGYEEQQKLRQLERQSRELKRRAAAAKELGDTPTAKRLRQQIRENSARIQQHADATGQRRKRDRERVPSKATEPTVPRQSPPAQPRRAAQPNEPRPAASLRVSRADVQHIVDQHAQWGADRQAQLKTLSDEELDQHLTAVTDAADYDALDAVVAEMERREAAATKAAEKADAKQAAQDEREQQQWEHFDRLLESGVDEEAAVADVFGRSVEQQRRDRAIMQLRGQGYTGRGFDELARKAFRDFVYARYLDAEGHTRGHMLNRAGEAAGVDPHTLFTGPAARARKHASDELKEWWDQNGRITYDEFEAGLLGDAQAARDAGFRTGGEDFLR